MNNENNNEANITKKQLHASRTPVMRKKAVKPEAEVDSVESEESAAPVDAVVPVDAVAPVDAVESEDAADSPAPDTVPSDTDGTDSGEENALLAAFAAIRAEEAAEQTEISPKTGVGDLFEDTDGEEYLDTEEPLEMEDHSSTGEPAGTEESSSNTKGKRGRKILKIAGIALAAIAICYLGFAFFPVGPIARWRTIYIQTAMTTGDHQWLATCLFPKSVIDRAYTEPGNLPADTDDDWTQHLQTVTSDTEGTGTEPVSAETTAPDTQTETETETTPDTTAPEDTYNDILGLADLVVGGEDSAGNTVTVVDMEEGLYIAEFTGKSWMYGMTYHGYVMLVDDPSRVFVGTTPEKKTRGYRIGEMMDYYGDVVAGINASGFADPNDSGTGADIIGACMSEGSAWGTYTNTMASIVLTTDNKLVCGWLGDWSNYTNIRDGMQFGPVIVKDGKNIIDDSNGGGLGMHPRTAIGQREDGSIVMIVIDGRVMSSAGCTVWDMAEMMVTYGAVTAGCCDGGSSVVLAYEGEVLNDNSSKNAELGRRMPNAFLVRSRKTDETEE